MFGSTVLDLAVGLIFTFLVISLITSATTEAFASAMKLRASTLCQGIKDLLNDEQFNGLALSVYNHALVNSQATGVAQTEAALTAKPSYIDATHFANAMIDLAGLSAGLTPGTTVQDLQAKVNANITDPQLNQMFNGIVTRTGGDIDRIRGEISDWFNSGMTRVAGSYKRKAQFWSFVIALLLTIALNIDTLKIANALWLQPSLVKMIEPSTSAVDALGQFGALPLPYGWDKAKFAALADVSMLLGALLGWLMTAVATLFGAPFWFDSLQKITQLRGAGSK
jgi:hypothetical protein